MIADRDGKNPLELMNHLNYKALSDTMVDYLQFENLIYYQEDVAKMLKPAPPNLIEFLETSLYQTETSAKIDRIEMPISTQMITFR